MQEIWETNFYVRETERERERERENMQSVS